MRQSDSPTPNSISDDEPDRRQSSSRASRLVIGVAIALVVVPMIWTAVPMEISRWYQDAALEAELDGDRDVALNRIDTAIAWNPQGANLFVHRAQIELELGQLDESLEDCNRALEIEPEQPIRAIYQRLLVHQRRQEHEQALQDADEIVSLASDQSNGMMSFDNALNLRAYARALANSQVKAGLEDIENAMLRQGGGNDNAAYLDTRGYLRYLDGDYEQALPDMERSVELAKARFEQLSSSPQSGDARVLEQLRKAGREELAVLYHHRALVYEKLGREEDAAKDFDRAQEYGYSPENGVW